jgi:hypothetical protein
MISVKPVVQDAADLFVAKTYRRKSNGRNLLMVKILTQYRGKVPNRKRLTTMSNIEYLPDSNRDRKNTEKGMFNL